MDGDGFDVWGSQPSASGPAPHENKIYHVLDRSFVKIICYVNCEWEEAT